MSGTIRPLPQYAFMAWFSVKAQGQLYLLPLLNVETCLPVRDICTYVLMRMVTISSNSGRSQGYSLMRLSVIFSRRSSSLEGFDADFVRKHLKRIGDDVKYTSLSCAVTISGTRGIRIMLEDSIERHWSCNVTLHWESGHGCMCFLDLKTLNYGRH
jgi:hypothetical protein